jgi:hypothetical protein
MKLAPSCRWKASVWPPASSTATPSGFSLRSALLANATEIIVLASSECQAVHVFLPIEFLLKRETSFNQRRRFGNRAIQ